MSAEMVRSLALDILVEVEAGRSLEPLLDSALEPLQRPAARALLAELVKGTLRWQGRYDHLIRRFSRRRMPRGAVLLALLRLTLHQLIALGGVPAYAAVHEGVELCRHRVGQRQVAFVNGLLQAVCRFLAAANLAPPEAILPLFADPGRDPAGFLSAYHSHPRWLIERWLARYGASDCRKLCCHNNEPPPLSLHVLAPADPGGVANRLAAQGLPTVAGRWHPRALIATQRLGRGALTAVLDAFPEVIVQDEGAQCATAWLVDGGLQASGPLLDLCAAPGGKTFHLRRLWPPSQLVVAMDNDRERLLRLAAAAKRVEAGRLGVVLADGMAPPFRRGALADVLLDGPCSGTGVLRHHPEGRWRLRASDLPRSGARLRDLALTAAGLLPADGVLWYVTCSLEPEENEEVVMTLLAAGAGLEPAGAGGCSATELPWRSWLPQSTATDGFFAARLRKRG